MRLRTIAAATVLAGAMCFPRAGVAVAQDLDSSDSPTQGESGP